jgi:hypothetical protein
MLCAFIVNRELGKSQSGKKSLDLAYMCFRILLRGFVSPLGGGNDKALSGFS